MKRVLLVLGVLVAVPVAFAQATAVKICDPRETAKCVEVGVDGGASPYAVPTTPAGVRLDQATVKTFTNCAATGSTAQVLPNGRYLMTVHDERTTVCLGSICDGGAGSDFPAGFGMLMKVRAADGGTPAACLSTGATGDVQFTRATE